jgi:hypothetical protein
MNGRGYVGAGVTAYPRSGRYTDGVKEDDPELRATLILGKPMAEVVYYLGGKEN